MIISMHIGAHATNGALLLRSLLKNASVLAEQGVCVPSPSRYRDILPAAMKKVRGERASLESQEMIIDELVDREGYNRIVLSYEDLICLPPLVFEKGQFYGKANFKLPWLRNVFADHRMEFFIGIRNPATFIPETFAMCGPRTSYADFIGNMALGDIRWANLAMRMHEACPDARLTFYVFEDTPILWPHLMRQITGVDARIPLEGDLDVVAGVMQREGMKRLRTYLHTHQPQTEQQRQRILSAFLDKYVDPDALEAEIELPGWTEDIVDGLTELYEDDLEKLATVPGVNLISL